MRIARRLFVLSIVASAAAIAPQDGAACICFERSGEDIIIFARELH